MKFFLWLSFSKQIYTNLVRFFDLGTVCFQDMSATPPPNKAVSWSLAAKILAVRTPNVSPEVVALFAGKSKFSMKISEHFKPRGFGGERGKILNHVVYGYL